ncbi:MULTISPECIES: DUF5067 domain-containing protein [Corynebacterium]|uniref:DUF5067 domain-containing protein n=1 Tax=Corynebacterium pseudogenitalium ATCC 33035 TaxID=525264 RepID=E2S6P3_9CORY|nr:MULTISPECIES: DUF5067 domain-containing protein [Corynebacterium]EFQ79685.1 hypothetical protein HMPREF0305_12195 [Corynebacterium pseudogenitalium ATCC 33035]MCG7462386.1 DUF5067 domain-containing protein [Corynebacterium tuberculostearicum]
MRKLLSSLIVVSALTLTSCSDSSSDKPKEDGSINSTSDAQADAKSVNGTWKQEDSASEDGWMEASITDDVITIEWVMGNGENRMIYWIGTFDAQAAASGETVSSNRDTVATASEWMAALSDKKDFSIEDDTLTFQVAIEDKEFTTHMKKVKDDPTTVKELKSTDFSQSFKDGVLDVPAAKFEITDHRVVKPGEPGNELGEKPLLVFHYDVTNKTDETLTTTDFVVYFTAIQDNDPNKVNELDLGSYLDPETSDTQLEQIKKGGTVAGTISYELDDLTTPVDLVASKSFSQDEIGRQTFELN